jgi:hypothetical protein
MGDDGEVLIQNGGAIEVFMLKEFYEPLGDWLNRNCYIVGGRGEHPIGGNSQLREGVTGGSLMKAFL